MSKIFRVFWRDIKRLAKTPAAWIVALFLIVLPSLYAWVNVYGFWNPYENTGNLRVCVVNDDEGCTSDSLGEVKLGDSIIETLEDNDQMDWVFVDKDEALDEIASGEAYAAFVIPSDFSSNIASILTGDIKEAKIDYYVNEKTGPVAPKITDAGATELDSTINSTFVSEVSAVVSEELDEKTSDLETAISTGKSKASAQVDSAINALKESQDTLKSFEDSIDGAKSKTKKARNALQTGKQALVVLSDDLEKSATLAATANSSATTIAHSLDSAFTNGSSALSLALVKSNATIGSAAGKITSAKGSVDSATKQIDEIVDSQKQTIEQLQSIIDLLPEGDTRDKLQSALDKATQVNNETAQFSSDLSTLAKDIDDTATQIANASDTLTKATQESLDIANGYRNSLNDDTLPTISENIVSLTKTTYSLASTISKQTALCDQASATLKQLETALTQSSKALSSTRELLSSATDSLSSLRADLGALGMSSTLSSLNGEIDSKQVASFMLSPTTVKTEQLYPLNSFGSAMAPLFINLTLWIGVFMLMVIMRLEVDDEGLRNTSITQRYLGRQLLLGLMAIAQAIVCCAGCLAIGVEVQNAALFVLTAAIASATYLAIQFALSSIFQHVGKALCVILVFIQIPGATGLYPIEMTTEFFRTVYPAFPFTYGINAIRETVFGFYGNNWINDIAVLCSFLVAFTLIGVLGRTPTANLNRLFARQLEKGDLINVEEVHLPDRRYRLSQLVSVIASHDEYRHEIEYRTSRFLRIYPRLKYVGIFLGIGVPIVVTPLLVNAGFDKVIILTSWLIWLAIVIGFLIVVEYVLDNMLHQVSLSNFSDSEIGKIYSQRNKGKRKFWKAPRHSTMPRNNDTHADVTGTDAAEVGNAGASASEANGAPEAGDEATDAAQNAQARTANPVEPGSTPNANSHDASPDAGGRHV